MVTRHRLKKSGAGSSKKSRLTRISNPNYIEKYRGQTITSGHNHSWEVTEDGKNKLTLGNWTDAGWFWDGDDSDMIGFLERISKSQITNEFLTDIRGKVDFNDLKPILHKALEKNNGLYEISGDNRVWHFGETFEIDSQSESENLKESHPELTKEQADQIVEDAFDYYRTDYDDFEKEHKEDYKEQMKKIIDESHSFDDFNSKISSEEFTQEWAENLFEFTDGQFHEALAKSFKAFEKKKKGGK